MERLIRRLLGGSTRRDPFGDGRTGVRIVAYDGTTVGPDTAESTIRITSPRFFHRVITQRASELSFARAYVAGEVEVDGDIYGVLALRERFGDVHVDRQFLRDAAEVLGVRSVKDLVKLRPLPAPPEEARPHGGLHSKARDARAISSHYDVSNDFYRLFLGESMTYSCAVFNDPRDPLDVAQANKYELICSKLGLAPGMRLLDIGCGWGGMVMHAARHHGVEAVGVTISRQQAQLAAKRVAEAGVADQVEIRLQDYRDVPDGPFDAVSSIGMFEHVGQKRLGEYFAKIETLLRPGGRLLNHAINRTAEQGTGRLDPDGFMARYVFPDAELLEVGQIVSAMNRNGLEVRHVESLREHYALTLREWVRRLEADWDEAVRLASLPRAKIWRLYMAASAVGFEVNDLAITQVLATKTTAGRSGMGLRPHW